MSLTTTEIEARTAASLGLAPVDIAAVLAAGDEATVMVTPQIRVNIGGPRHGVWAIGHSSDPLMPPPEVRVTDWVAWRSAEHVVATITDDRKPAIVPDSSAYEVELVRADGRRFRTSEPLSGADSTNVNRILTVLNAGVAGVLDRRSENALKSVLLKLGHETQKRELSWRRGGWVELPDGRVAYIEPLSAMTADGIVNDLEIEGDHGSDSWSGSIGISTDKAAETLRAFLAIAPDRLDVMLAALGAVGASSLALHGRTTCNFVAKAGSAKSVLLDTIQRWTSAPERGRSFSIDLSGNSASAGFASMKMSRFGGLVTADDARFVNPRDFVKFEAIAQAAYQAKRDGKLTVDGKQRQDRFGSGQAIAVATSETVPENEHAEAVVGRVVFIPIGVGDIDISEGGAVDTWNLHYAEAANKLRGAYVHWLARKAQATGLPSFIAETNAAARQGMHKLGASRQTQVVSVLLTGWTYFAQFLLESGVDVDAIVSESEAIKAFQTILDGTSVFAREANPAVPILAWIRNAITGGTGFVATLDGEAPNQPQHFGWVRGDHGFQPRGSQLGVLNQAEGTLLITGAAIDHAKRALGMGGISKGTITAGLDSIEAVLNPGQTDRTPVPAGFGRSPGAIVPVGWLS